MKFKMNINLFLTELPPITCYTQIVFTEAQIMIKNLRCEVRNQSKILISNNVFLLCQNDLIKKCYILRLMPTIKLPETFAIF